MDHNQGLQRQAIVLYQTKDGSKSVDVILAMKHLAKSKGHGKTILCR